MVISNLKTLNLVDLEQWRIQDFPEEGALTPKVGGRQPIIWPIFPKNCMKMKKFWTRGGARGTRAPLRSATVEVGQRYWSSLSLVVPVKQKGKRG